MFIPENQGQRAEFEKRFSRCRNSLYLLALGALGSVWEAEAALENCYRKACREPRGFSFDGEFGGWMIRRLIDEIVLTANERKGESRVMSEAEYLEARLIEAWAGDGGDPV